MDHALQNLLCGFIFLIIFLCNKIYVRFWMTIKKTITLTKFWLMQFTKKKEIILQFTVVRVVLTQLYCMCCTF